MATVTKYLFALDANNYVTSGIVLTYDDANPEPLYPAEYTHEGDANVWANQHLAHWDDTTSAFIIDAPDPAVVLQAAKDAKVAWLRAQEADKLKTFPSAALGTTYTYLSGQDDMILLNGEYSFVRGPDYDNSAIIWFTMESGNVPHTAAQFVQVYLDGRNHVASTKYARATKEAQTSACTTETQIDTIGYPNPAPPSVPVGLNGGAGAAGSGEVTLTWTANTDVTMIGGGGYNVYVDGVKANTSLVTSATYIASGLAVGAHTFAITAVDTDGLESAQTAAITVTIS